jgi:hypothetical protein
MYDDPQSPFSSLDESLDIETPSKPHTAQSRLNQSHTINTSQAAGSDVHHQRYCTQAYLLGLVQRRPLDEACPNVSTHRTFRVGSYYALD